MPNIPAPKPVFIDGDEVDPSLLTAEERAGFEEFDDFDPDAKIPTADDDDDDANDDDDGDKDQDDDQGDDGDDDDDAAAKAAADAAAEKAAADDQQGSDDDDGDDQGDDDVVVFRMADIPPESPPEASTQRLGEIEAKITTIEEEFEDGGLTTQEFRKQLSELEREAGKLQAADEAAQAAYEAQISTFSKAMEGWQKSCAAFYEKHPDYREDVLANRDLNELVRSLQGKTRGNIYDPAIIEQAHEMLSGRGGQQQRKPAAAQDPGKREKPRTAPRNNPPNLGGLPVAEAGDVTEGEFSRLDAMLEAGKNAEYEAALESMTDAQRARYEAQG